MVYITRSTLGREINKYLQRLKVDIFRRIRFFVFIIHRLCNLLFCLSIQRYIWNVKQSWLSEYRYINLRLCQVNYFIRVIVTELVTRRCWGKNSRTKPCCSKSWREEQLQGFLGTLPWTRTIVYFHFIHYQLLKTFAHTMLNNIFSEDVALALCGFQAGPLSCLFYLSHQYTFAGPSLWSALHA